MEDFKTFNPSRQEFAPYGLTCERWRPQPLPRFDRHNEVEINYFPYGGASYLISNKIVEISARRLVVFWALAPHKTLKFLGEGDYYVCTIPLATFLSWKISGEMQKELFSGSVLSVADEGMADYDEWLLRMWHDDLSCGVHASQEVIMQEMKARISRFSQGYECLCGTDSATHTRDDCGRMFSEKADVVSRLAMYISQNSHRSVKAVDIGKAVGLHPDYANSLFRKAFGCTLHQYLLQERVCHAERLLVTTDMPVTEIGSVCGFSTASRFNETFQKLDGCAPSEYRKRCMV